jgi:DNA topoisomerase VI subunit A
MSTKGMSVTASRLLVDQLCGEHKIPLLVLHDLDKSGFSIVGTLRRNTRRYSFANAIQVIDLGLRLKDVEEWRLESETVVHGKSDPRDNLYANGATDDEVAFLYDEERSMHYRHVGQRVELNAFPSGRFGDLD